MARLDFYTAVNMGGVGWLLRWQQDELGELTYRSRSKVLLCMSISLCTHGAAAAVLPNLPATLTTAMPGYPDPSVQTCTHHKPRWI